MTHPRALLIAVVLTSTILATLIPRPGTEAAGIRCSLPTADPQSTACDYRTLENVRGIVRERRAPGRPVAGAIVAVTARPWYPCPTAVTDSTGSFSMRCTLLMPCGCNAIVVIADGFEQHLGEYSSYPLSSERTVIGLLRAGHGEVFVPVGFTSDRRSP